jgi:dihydrofolate synthase/folylpolyglutamate synthase
MTMLLYPSIKAKRALNHVAQFNAILKNTSHYCSMKYQEALDYLLNRLPMFQRIGPAAYRADLKNITELCKLLGNPHQNLSCIHVAGTNGKGSVTHILGSVLTHAGYRVGIYTSPHYLSFRERIKIGKYFIEEDFIAEFVSKNIDAFSKVDASFFEITTAMMFEYFRQQKTDYCVIETGLGGRLDSTNILMPCLSVITNISYDHQSILGDTLEKIAFEKAGIIKPNIPVVIGEKQEATQGVFMEKAKRENAPICFSDEIVEVTCFEKGKVEGIEKMSGERFCFYIDLLGKYQQRNLQTALAALFLLQSKIPGISPEAMRKGISSVASTTYFIGRWTVKGKDPMIVLDSAHNPAGIEQVLLQLKDYSFKKLHFVYGTVADKDIAKILSQLPIQALYYFCKPSVPRGKNEQDLQKEAEKFGLKGMAFPSPKEALEAAKKNAEAEDFILVAGSIFLVADILRLADEFT